MSELQIHYRDMVTADIPSGLLLCRAAQWNQTDRDWELFLRLSPRGCRVAVQNERVIGTVATVCYETRFSWIGMVLVDPSVRGRGVGSRLISEALDVLKDMPSIRLDATPAGQAVYRKLDFVDEYCLSRMEIATPCSGLTQSGNPSRPMAKGDLPAVALLDRKAFGADRRLTLEWLLDGAPDYAWVVEERKRVIGYTFGRRGFNFEHLGPVIAEDQGVARLLVSACLKQHAGSRFILDASHHEPDWREWLESIGFREQRQFIRMFYRNNPYPGLPLKQFGILGPEFG